MSSNFKNQTVADQMIRVQVREAWPMMSTNVRQANDRCPRLIWVVNHKTLLPAEVPILRSLGYAVFIPKRVPNVPDYRSAVVEYGYDADLKMPDEALAILNFHRFYDREWSPTLTSILNKYFDVLVSSVSAFTTPLFEAIRKFEGSIVARVFGRENPARYTTFFEMSEDMTLLDRVEAMGNRFVFGQGFDNLAEIEDLRLSQRARTLTVSVPEFVWERRGSWKGGEKKVLLLCPNIRDSKYYGDIYSELKAIFKDVPHAIFGRQNIPPDDPAVLPYMTDAKLLDLYGRMSVFVYPSIEPRHVHYSPIEAMIVGTPVLYRSGGMLDHLAGRRLPACCDSKGEIREKALQLLSGDIGLEVAIRESQEKIIEKFSTDLARAEWAEVLAHSCSRLDVVRPT